MTRRILNPDTGVNVSRAGPEYPVPVEPRTAADLSQDQVWLAVTMALKSKLHPAEHCFTLFGFVPTEHCRGIIDQVIRRAVFAGPEADTCWFDWTKAAWVRLGWRWWRGEPMPAGVPGGVDWWPEGE